MVLTPVSLFWICIDLLLWDLHFPSLLFVSFHNGQFWFSCCLSVLFGLLSLSRPLVPLSPVSLTVSLSSILLCISSVMCLSVAFHHLSLLIFVMTLNICLFLSLSRLQCLECLTASFLLLSLFRFSVSLC